MLLSAVVLFYLESLGHHRVILERNSKRNLHVWSRRNPVTHDPSIADDEKYVDNQRLLIQVWSAHQSILQKSDPRTGVLGLLKQASLVPPRFFSKPKFGKKKRLGVF